MTLRTGAAVLLLAAASCGFVARLAAQNEQREPVTQTEVLHSVRQQVALQTGVDVKRVAPGKPLRELGVDKLDLVELVMALEEQYHVEIPDDALGGDGTRDRGDELTAQRLADIVITQIRRQR